MPLRLIDCTSADRAEPMHQSSDLTTQLAAREPLANPECASWTVTVIDGPDNGKSWRFDDVAARRIMIGHSPACDVFLSDRTVSRRHVALEQDAEGVRIVDLGSRNGTWLGRSRIRDVYAIGGETIRVGDTTIVIQTDGIVREMPVTTEASFRQVAGISPQMRALYPHFARVAATELPILIEGETGTGKEVLAESLHEGSERRNGPFVVLDCTTISAALIESELFGHERGAFTGADTTRVGLFESAHGGTLFLDEIGDLDLTLQAKLLRALERREIRRVGGNRWLKVDVRIIAATRRDLDREVQAKRFRDDLFHRLAVARLELPPLRQRAGDITFLARLLWVRMGGDEAALSAHALERLERYDWPGNVRELQNAVAQLLSIGDFTPPQMGPTRANADFIDTVVRSGMTYPCARTRVIDEFMRRFVEHMLAAHNGNVTRAAAASGIGRRYFQAVRGKL
jgi:transcriptional regulator with GAF, ATPase, and Fis domain